MEAKVAIQSQLDVFVQFIIVQHFKHIRDQHQRPLNDIEMMLFYNINGDVIFGPKHDQKHDKDRSY